MIARPLLTQPATLARRRHREGGAGGAPLGGGAHKASARAPMPTVWTRCAPSSSSSHTPGQIQVARQTAICAWRSKCCRLGRGAPQAPLLPRRVVAAFTWAARGPLGVRGRCLAHVRQPPTCAPCNCKLSLPNLARLGGPEVVDRRVALALRARERRGEACMWVGGVCVGGGGGPLPVACTPPSLAAGPTAWSALGRAPRPPPRPHTHAHHLPLERTLLRIWPQSAKVEKEPVKTPLSSRWPTFSWRQGE